MSKRRRGLHISLGLAIVLCTGCRDERFDRTSSIRSSEVATTSPDNPQGRAPPPIKAHQVPERKCRECHESIYDSYQNVAMAQSFSSFDADRAIESFAPTGGGNHLFHAASGRHYEMSVEKGAMFVTRYRVREDATRFAVRRQRVDHVIGSGNHVRGYFYRNDAGEMFELPVVWYAQESRWGMAPGYDHADHEGFDRPVTRQCMFCHNAYPEFAEGTDAFGEVHSFPASLPHGVGCQRCHGPGGQHVQLAHADATETQLRDSIINPADLTPALAEDVCLQCHLQPTSRRTSIVQRFGKTDYAFQAGQPLREYLVHLELDEDTPRTNRFDINHHPYRLHQSKCFQRSASELSCTKCHDPHVKVAAADRAAHYRERCLTCHGGDDCLEVQRGRAPDADCVSCHMPTRRTEDVVHVTMTDHKIARRSQLEHPTAELAEASLELDLPMRLYERAKSDRQQSKRLYALIAAARDHSPRAMDDLQMALREHPPTAIEPWLQLGQSQVEHGRFADAVTTLRGVLDRNRKNALAQANLGAALVGLREYEAAAEHLRRATMLQPQRPESWFNLGLAFAKMGDSAAGQAAYERALQLRPTYAKCHFNLGNLFARHQDYSAARTQFERVIALDPDSAEAYVNLAAVHGAVDDWPAAIRVLEDGLISLPGNRALSSALEIAREKN